MRRRIQMLMLMLAAAALTGCTGGGANTNSTGNTTRSGANGNAMSSASPAGSMALSDDEREFLKAAAQGGMTEVELGRMVVQKAQSPDVKRFGQQMIDDHTKANAELKQLAVRKNVQLPTDMKGDQREEGDKLAKLSGAEFDREYMDYMVKDHEEDVEEFKDTSEDAKDADVKAFAAKTLPVLQQHLQMAKETRDKVKK